MILVKLELKKTRNSTQLEIKVTHKLASLSLHSYKILIPRNFQSST